jgi:hypothetical protein
MPFPLSLAAVTYGIWRLPQKEDVRRKFHFVLRMPIAGRPTRGVDTRQIHAHAKYPGRQWSSNFEAPKNIQ